MYLLGQYLCPQQLGCQEEYANKRAIRQPVDFESETITLDIPMKGISIEWLDHHSTNAPCGEFLRHRNYTVSTMTTSTQLAVYIHR